MSGKVEVIEKRAEAIALHVSSNTGGISALVTTKTGKPYDTVKREFTSEVFSPWGDNNLRPQDLVGYVERNDLIPTIIDFKARALYSQGIAYGYEDIVDGKKVFTRVLISEIEEFFESARINNYLIEAADDLYTFRNEFVEFRRDAQLKIIEISCIDATECRLEKQDPADGMIKNIYVNANWDNGGSASNSDVVSALYPHYDVANQILASKKLRAILPLRTVRRGRKYYDKAEWEGLIDTGWLDLSQSIPKFKKSLMENQIYPKWHVQIPENYWPWRFKDWSKLDDKKKEENIAAVLDEFISFMKGADKAGNAFISTYRYNETMMKEYPTWRIEPIKADMKGGEYIEDSQEADFHIVRAFGVAPPLIGISPGKGMSAGSGSDIRVLFNKHLLMEKSAQDRLLYPLQIAATVNGWHKKYASVLKDKPLKFLCESYFMATLDQVNNENRM